MIFIRNTVTGEVKTTLIDYVRQASFFASANIDHFYKEMINELVSVVEYVPGLPEDEVIEKIWCLCNRHGKQVQKAIKSMREAHDDPFLPPTEGSLLQLVGSREYLKEPVERLALAVCDMLGSTLPIAFRKNLPRDENDLNDKVSALLQANRDDFSREHPAVMFALARSVPDHSSRENKLLVESKYIRGSTSPSKASEGIAADLIKYPESSHILFIVYDPNRSISDDQKFRSDFERKGRCTICIQ